MVAIKSIRHFIISILKNKLTKHGRQKYEISFMNKKFTATFIIKKKIYKIKLSNMLLTVMLTIEVLYITFCFLIKENRRYNSHYKSVKSAPYLFESWQKSRKNSKTRNKCKLKEEKYITHYFLKYTELLSRETR